MSERARRAGTWGTVSGLCQSRIDTVFQQGVPTVCSACCSSSAQLPVEWASGSATSGVFSFAMLSGASSSRGGICLSSGYCDPHPDILAFALLQIPPEGVRKAAAEDDRPVLEKGSLGKDYGSPRQRMPRTESAARGIGRSHGACVQYRSRMSIVVRWGLDPHTPCILVYWMVMRVLSIPFVCRFEDMKSVDSSRSRKTFRWEVDGYEQWCSSKFTVAARLIHHFSA